VTAFIATSVAGFLLQKELDYLQGAVDVPKRPFAAIVGGSKVSSKISVIEAMLSKVNEKEKEHVEEMNSTVTASFSTILLNHFVFLLF
jgi:Phosphoglycerate kinase